MKYCKLSQGKTSKVDGRWKSPKGMKTLEEIEYNKKHGLLTEITIEQSKHADWGLGNYKQLEDGTYECICSNWDSLG